MMLETFQGLGYLRATRYLIPAIAKLASGVQHSEHRFQCGLARLGVHVAWDALASGWVNALPAGHLNVYEYVVVRHAHYHVKVRVSISCKRRLGHRPRPSRRPPCEG